MDDVAARLDELGGLIEMVAGRQGRFEPFMAQALAPITERLVGLADLGGRGFDRLAGKFGQLSSVVPRFRAPGRTRFAPGSRRPRSTSRPCFVGSTISARPSRFGRDGRRGER